MCLSVRPPACLLLTFLSPGVTRCVSVCRRIRQPNEGRESKEGKERGGRRKRILLVADRLQGRQSGLMVAAAAIKKSNFSLRQEKLFCCTQSLAHPPSSPSPTWTSTLPLPLYVRSICGSMCSILSPSLSKLIALLHPWWRHAESAVAPAPACTR